MIVGSVKELEEISAAIAACQRCKLAETRIKVVPGEGSHKAGVMFIGEAPGERRMLKEGLSLGELGNFLIGF